MLKPVDAERRANIATTVIEIFSLYLNAYFGRMNIGDMAEEVLIGGAIMIGQSQDRPMTAGDIADMLGVARSTVLRKLAVMERAGMVASKRVGRRKVFWNARANDQRVIEHLERIIIRAAKRCEELSKLDNSTG